MSSLLKLSAPTPASNLEFEDMFFGDPSSLVVLSKARRDFARSNNDLAATDAYRTLWLAFWQRSILFAGSHARSRLPLEFAWNVSLFSPGGSAPPTPGTTTSNATRSAAGGVGGAGAPHLYRDSSPLLETACVTLALIVAHQRLCASGGEGAEFEEHARAARELTEWVRSDVLEAFMQPRVARPPDRVGYGSLADAIASQSVYRRREPEVFGPTLYKMIAYAVDGQLLCKRAIAALGAHDLTRATAAFFRGARRFQEAAELLPAERSLRLAHTRASALAHSHLAQTIVAAGDEHHYGVAVALMREAAAIDPANASIHRLADEYEQRNRIEFGMQTIPAGDSVILAFTAGGQSPPGPPAEFGVVAIEESVETGKIHVTVPLM